MPGLDSGQFGKLLIAAGLMLIVAGGVFIGLSKLGLFRLPGDMEFGGKNWKVYFPIASCIVLSVILTLMLWLIQRFRK